MTGCIEVAQAWILASDLFETRVIESFIEYSDTVRDELLVSVYKPK